LPAAVGLGKEVAMPSFKVSLEKSLLLKRISFYLMFASTNQPEVVLAFMEKKPTHFKKK